MEIRLAKTAGFCFGVKRAVEKVYEQIEKGKKIYTFGPIIHNEAVVADLEKKGVEVIEDVESLKEIKEGSVVIRSHGVSREIYDILTKQELECIDATCPFVKKIHRIVEKESGEGKQIIIIGNDSHPEVEGIKGWCQNAAIVIESASQAQNLKLPENQKVCTVSQTTFNYNKFQELVEIINKKGYDIIVLNTICNATEERQTQSRALAKEVEAMIVVGGKSSSNTQKLFEICKNECANTYYIQTIDDLDPAVLRTIDNVGITAGASTPNKIIEEVQNNVRNEF